MLSIKEIGEKIKKLREERGKSQEELGEYLGGKSHAAISDIERGVVKKFPPYDTLRQIALFFDMTVSELVEDEAATAFQENWRVSGFNLSDEERKKFLESIDHFKKFIASSERSAKITGKEPEEK